MQSCGLLLVWLSVSLAAQTGGDTAAHVDRYVDLFIGKDLTGWVNVNCAPETWSVRDGVLHCTGKPTGALRTERMFDNFELEIEWRHVEKGGNAGIFVWAAPLAAKGAPFLRSIEVQVLDHGYGNTADYTTHGDVFPIRARATESDTPTKPKPKPRPRYSWAELLRRVYLIEVLTCPHCNGRRRLLAFITDTQSITRILAHLGLPIELPTLAPARAPPRSALPFA